MEDQKNVVTVVQTGDVQEIELTEGMTVLQALGEADISEEDLKSDGLQVRLNNKVIEDLDAVLAAGDQLMVVGNIAGA